MALDAVEDPMPANPDASARCPCRLAPSRAPAACSTTSSPPRSVVIPTASTRDDPYDDEDFELLTDGGQEIINDGNAGGSSLLSEVFAYEVLERCELASLLATEMEVSYLDPDSKITDLLVEIDGMKIGVSVTRAVGYPREAPYPLATAKSLLQKKLEGILDSSENVAPEHKWVKQILHVARLQRRPRHRDGTGWNETADTLKADHYSPLHVTTADDSSCKQQLIPPGCRRDAAALSLAPAAPSSEVLRPRASARRAPQPPREAASSSADAARTTARGCSRCAPRAGRLSIERRKKVAVKVGSAGGSLSVRVQCVRPAPHPLVQYHVGPNHPIAGVLTRTPIGRWQGVVPSHQSRPRWRGRWYRPRPQGTEDGFREAPTTLPHGKTRSSPAQTTRRSPTAEPARCDMWAG